MTHEGQHPDETPPIAEERIMHVFIMNRPVDHFEQPSNTCAHYVPDHIRENTPTLEEYLNRIEIQNTERDRDDDGMTLYEKAVIFGGSILVTSVTVGALALAQVDQTFHLGLGQRLAHIKPTPHGSEPKRSVEQFLHDFGQKVVKDEK